MEFLCWYLYLSEQSELLACSHPASLAYGQDLRVVMLAGIVPGVRWLEHWRRTVPIITTNTGLLVHRCW